MRIRAAHGADQPLISAITAPAIAAGQLLPHAHPPTRRHVAEAPDGRIVGVVSLQPWSSDVIELGGLVSTVSGHGIGRMLVDVALREAADEQYTTVVALTAIPGFFSRLGFSAHAQAPWRWARQTPLRVPHDHLGRGVLLKSTRCGGCPRLGSCSQVLMVRSIAEARVA